ncbi:MAG: FtsX-like permease family protein, partial [Spirochaetota bacterium]|nr:FtsX-like permease family protein [Spirochaetota bacterium]
ILVLSFMAPSIITIIIKLIRPLFLKIFKRGMTLSGDNITRSLGRNSITISTLMICIALVVSIITLIQSYHYSIGKWFNQVNNADFSIVSGSSYADGDIFPMDENRIDSIIKNPKTKAMIKDIDFYRFYTTSYNGDLIDILSFKVNVAKNHVRFTFIPNENQDSVFETMINDDAILISENMASKHKIKKGDFIKLMTKSGKKDFKVAGIIVNYLSSKGIVSISRQLFIKHWNDKLVDAFKIYLQNNVRVKEFREFVYKTIDKPENLIFKTLKEFKTDVINAINETFIMFHALEFITVLIAILGIINALLASILERKREIGILRSIGATKSQISVMILTEAGLIGIIGAIIGVIGGILLSLVTVFVINKQTVGWYLEYDLPITILIYILIGSFILSTISGYYPSRKAANIIIHNALEYE